MAVQHSALSGVEHGYDVQVVVDACGGLSARTEDATIRRLIQAGATVTSCASVAGQLMGDLSQGTRGMEVLKIMFEIAGSQPVAVTGESPGRA
jgi:Isochorismatase family